MWDEAASKKFLSPTLSRKFVLKKYVLRVVGSLRGKQLLEFGCGSGFWTRLFRDAGAVCTGVDASRKQIELARSLGENDIVYIVKDASVFRSKSRFDIVYIDHVLSETSSTRKAGAILASARRALKKEGMLVLSEVHPSIAHFSFPNARPGKGYSYFRRGAELLFNVEQENGEHIAIRDYHWALSDISLLLKKAGFLIEEVIEPRAPASAPGKYLKLRHKSPSHIIIKARLA